MVFAPIFTSCLHLSIQKEQNKVMLFKHVSVVHMGRIDHRFQAVTRPGFALSSRAAPASWLLFVVWAVLIHCLAPAVPEWWQGILIPTTAQSCRMVGCFCQGVYSTCWDLCLTLGEVISVSDVSASTLISWNFSAPGRGSQSPCPSTSYPSGRHSTGLIPIVNSDWISVLVTENIGCTFFKTQKEVFYLNI